LSAGSAVDEVAATYGVPVIAIATLTDLLAFLESDSAQARDVRVHRDAVKQYRLRYGA
jgi:orotate phosphoribosyltransferase